MYVLKHRYLGGRGSMGGRETAGALGTGGAGGGVAGMAAAAKGGGGGAAAAGGGGGAAATGSGAAAGFAAAGAPPAPTLIFNSLVPRKHKLIILTKYYLSNYVSN